MQQASCLLFFPYTLLLQLSRWPRLCYTGYMSMIYLSETAHPLLQDYLKARGHRLHIIEKTGLTYEPVSSHPDIYMCSLGPGGPIFFGDPKQIGSSYPENILFNAACTGTYFIHNLKHTCPSLLKAADGCNRIHVSQGYTKCNIVLVDQTSIITSDKGIFNACRKELDVLLIRPGHVKLRRFPYGFLGGASGRIGSEVLFNGNLELHPDFEGITAFIRQRGLTPVYFTQYPLEDIGSILEDPMA